MVPLDDLDKISCVSKRQILLLLLPRDCTGIVPQFAATSCFLYCQVAESLSAISILNSIIHGDIGAGGC